MKPQRILIADDEQHIVQVLSLTLTRGGYDVVTADSGDAAWQAVLQHDPDLIITDESMPGMTGTQLAQRVHKNEQYGQGKTTPVLIVTARHIAPTDGPSANITGILPKPFSPRQVLAHVADLVGPARASEENLS